MQALVFEDTRIRPSKKKNLRFNLGPYFFRTPPASVSQMDCDLVRAVQQVELELRSRRSYIPRQPVTTKLLYNPHFAQRAFLKRLTEQNDAYDLEQKRIKLDVAHTLASLEVSSSPTPESARP